MKCLWCGRELKGQRKFCCRECLLASHKVETEKAKPPKYTHCQNPECGKELNHWVKFPSRKGSMYVQNLECCDMACQARKKSIVMKGKDGNLKRVNTSKRKYIPIDFTKQAKLVDPLQMLDHTYDC